MEINGEKHQTQDEQWEKTFKQDKSQFKYIGLIISEMVSWIEIISRRTQKVVTFPKLSGK